MSIGKVQLSATMPDTPVSANRVAKPDTAKLSLFGVA
eukprot:CAMPEP_0114325020 /NCGR_PEP_ID=MMETSP0059-20121206/28862_1 /TAXON_ID=36894 /ORGANISM="Pyramimonas parkeae, Strain CCMP726" /LENGTH=36 /DNA_ID= /DNA_START= /DNA_END= /DNA_ORIENTATION=